MVSALPYKCPGAPPEAAMLIADFFRKRGMLGKVSVDVFTPEPQPMPVAGPKLGEAVRSMLTAKGVQFHAKHKLVSIDAERRELAFEQQQGYRYDLLIVIPPHRAPAVVTESGLTDSSGWVPVDSMTLTTSRPNVWAIGDVTTMRLPGRWNPDIPLTLPKAGVFAHAQGQVVAQEISSAIRHQPCEVNFCGEGYCMLEAGEDMAGFAFGDFFAQPSPRVELRRIGKAWHMGKVLFEKWWLTPPGAKRTLTGWTLKAGSGIYGIPITL